MKRSLIIPFFLSLIVACEKYERFDPNNQEVYYTSSSGIIGRAGGEIIFNDPGSNLNGTKIIVPKGALDEIVNIKLNVVRTICPDTDSTIDILKIEPQGLVANIPIQLHIPFDPIGRYPKLYQYDPDSSIISLMPVNYLNKKESFLEGYVTHFTEYFIADRIYSILNTTVHKPNNILKVSFDTLDSPSLNFITIDHNNQHLISSLNNLEELFQYISSGNSISLFGHIYADLYEGDWQNSKIIKSIKLITTIEDADSQVSIDVNMIEPEEKILYHTETCQNHKEATDLLYAYFLGESLVFDFNSVVEDDKEYWVVLKWFISSSYSIENRYTKLYRFIICNDLDNSPISSDNMSSFDPDVNRNYIRDSYETNSYK